MNPSSNILFLGWRWHTSPMILTAYGWFKENMGELRPYDCLRP